MHDYDLEDGDFPAHLAKLPATPTTAAPGSDEKIRTMAERYSRREQLSHPCDARSEYDSLPLLFLRSSESRRTELVCENSARATGFCVFFGSTANTGTAG